MKSRTLAFFALAALSAAGAHALHSAPNQDSSIARQELKQRFYVNTPRIALDAATRVATEVAYGRIESSRIEVPERGVAKTVYALRVLQALKGSNESVIEVSVAGAVNERVHVEVIGAPHFEIGDDVVLFLWSSPDSDETGVLGLSRGVYRVDVDADGNRLVSGDHADHEELGSFFERLGAAWILGEDRADAQTGK